MDQYLGDRQVSLRLYLQRDVQRLGQNYSLLLIIAIVK